MLLRKKKRTLNSAFKTKLVLEALKENLSLSELAEQFEVHPKKNFCLEEGVSSWGRGRIWEYL